MRLPSALLAALALTLPLAACGDGGGGDDEDRTTTTDREEDEETTTTEAEEEEETTTTTEAEEEPTTTTTEAEAGDPDTGPAAIAAQSNLVAGDLPGFMETGVAKPVSSEEFVQCPTIDPALAVTEANASSPQFRTDVQFVQSVTGVYADEGAAAALLEFLRTPDAATCFLDQFVQGVTSTRPTATINGQLAVDTKFATAGDESLLLTGDLSVVDPSIPQPVPAQFDVTAVRTGGVVTLVVFTGVQTLFPAEQVAQLTGVVASRQGG